MSSDFVWIQVTPTKRRLVRKSDLEEPRVHPARSKKFAVPQGAIISKGVAHIARSLPKGKREDGSPAIRGADGYTAEGFPIVESQATIDRIRRENPEYGLDHGERVMDDICSDAGI